MRIKIRETEASRLLSTVRNAMARERQALQAGNHFEAGKAWAARTDAAIQIAALVVRS